MEELSRRTFIRSAVAGAAGVVAGNLLAGSAFAADTTSGSASASGSMAASGTTSKGGKMTPGTYEATAQGFMGEDTVLVTVDENSILSVVIKESTDYPSRLTKVPLSIMPGRIVDAQSVDVDVVAGATFTSTAIKTATKDAIAQAGGKGLFEGAPQEAEKKKGDDVETDVLVIGGGGAGIMSALSAKYVDFDGIDSGLSVVMVEKLDFCGGSTMLSGGGFIAGMPLSQQPSQDFIDDAIERLQQKNDGNVNKALAEAILSVSGDTVLKMQRQGVGLMTTGCDDADTDYRVADHYVIGPLKGVRPSYEWAAYHYFDTFETMLANTDIDIRTGTSATELIVEDGAVVGAKVEGPDSIYSIRAKKVILACGGFAQNTDFIEKYAPHDQGSIVFSNGGADGDGIAMGEAVGAKIVGDRMLGYLGTNYRFGMWGDYSGIFNYGGIGVSIHVNTEGKRYICDSPFETNFEYAAVLEQPDKKAFAIIDSDNPYVDVVKNSTLTPELVFTADTIDGLADAIGVPADTLNDTIGTYNEAYDAGKDADFDTLNENMLPVRTAPFYAMQLNPIHLGSLVGLQVDENCEVINTDGDVIPNLYAAGECCFGGNLVTIYFGGFGVGTALYSGRICGEQAKSAILG